MFTTLGRDVKLSFVIIVNINYFQERAIIIGAQLGLGGLGKILIIICARHLALSTIRWLKATLPHNYPLRSSIAHQLFFSEESAIRQIKREDCLIVFNEVLGLLDTDTRQELKVHQYLEKNVQKPLLGIVGYVADRSDYFDAPIHKTTNPSESFNAVIKGMISHEPVTVSQLISQLWQLSFTQLEDVTRALSNQGEYRLNDSAKQHLNQFRDKDQKKFIITFEKDDKAKLNKVLKRLHTLPRKTKKEMEAAWKVTEAKHKKKLEKKSATFQGSDNEAEEEEEEEDDDGETRNSSDADNLFDDLKQMETRRKDAGDDQASDDNQDSNDDQASDDDQAYHDRGHGDDDDDHDRGHEDEEGDEDDEGDEDASNRDSEDFNPNKDLMDKIYQKYVKRDEERKKKKKEEKAEKKKRQFMLVKDTVTKVVSVKQDVKKKIGQTQSPKTHRTTTHKSKKKKGE